MHQWLMRTKHFCYQFLDLLFELEYEEMITDEQTVDQPHAQTIE